MKRIHGIEINTHIDMSAKDLVKMIPTSDVKVIKEHLEFGICLSCMKSCQVMYLLRLHANIEG
jgi:hypothetical protein